MGGYQREKSVSRKTSVVCWTTCLGRYRRLAGLRSCRSGLRESVSIGLTERACTPKLKRSLAELAEAISEEDGGAIEAEVGDVFLAMVNLARHLGVDAESAVRQANHRFESRFRVMEQAAAEDNSDLQHEALDQIRRSLASREAAFGFRSELNVTCEQVTACVAYDCGSNDKH